MEHLTVTPLSAGHDSPTQNSNGAVDDLDTSPFFDYLRTPQGHEVATRVLGIFDDLKRAALGHSARQVTLEKVFQIVIVTTVVAAATWLAVVDKFSVPVGVLFGTLVGYIFGKKAS